ncbi:hypothetical protein [Zhihengliuella salsuginis]|uniref:Uncharacterized protein n=1 Tax=Zhihengliuella salsuginis TaxID=578222 RepID=A0ABQ3GH33_9MICC|nr:hypothetical protein [Zhihengliuella salsuginis]GHD04847.1 hypothetical protein GCM10008096_12740 [Zhihengliuella salsuginis]
MRKILKATLVGAMSAGLLFGASVPAHAGASYGFNIATSFSKYMANDGKAHAKGTINFHGKWAFTANVGVRDLCASTGKGDGFGAYSTVRVRYMDGSTVGYWGGRDTNGCGTRFEWKKKYHNHGKKVRWVQMAVVEYDADTGYGADRAVSRRIDNPYTG